VRPHVETLEDRVNPAPLAVTPRHAPVIHHRPAVPAAAPRLAAGPRPHHHRRPPPGRRGWTLLAPMPLAPMPLAPLPFVPLPLVPLPLAPPPPAPAPAPVVVKHYLNPFGEGPGAASGWAPSPGQPVTLTVDASALPAADIPSLQAALQTLSSVAPGRLTLVLVHDPAGANITVGMASPSDAARFPTVGAWTTPSVEPTPRGTVDGMPYYRLTHVATQIFPTFSWWTDPSSPVPAGSGQVDLRSIFEHELGHAVGLGHAQDYQGVNDDGLSVMAPSLNTGQSRWAYGPDEAAVLDTLY
jgi:hypothetical protein